MQSCNSAVRPKCSFQLKTTYFGSPSPLRLNNSYGLLIYQKTAALRTEQIVSEHSICFSIAAIKMKIRAYLRLYSIN